MKPLFHSCLVLILSQTLVASAWADMACEKKHQKALKDLITISGSLDDGEIKKVLLDGKKSGVDIFSLDAAKAQASVDAKSGDINAILSQLNCKSEEPRIEAVKRAFLAGKYETAVRVLNSNNGLNGLLAKENAILAKGEKPPVQVDVAVESGDDDDGGDASGEVTRPPHYPRVHVRPQTQYPVRIAADGLWIVDTEHPVIPKKGPFHIDFRSLPAARHCKNLTRSQWQQVALGRANCDGGSYQRID
jgi:hypothetical protein